MSILVLIFVRHRWIALEGVVTGTAFGIAKLYFMGAVYGALLLSVGRRSTAGKSFLKYITGQLAVLLLLLISIRFGLFFFIGVTAGTLLVPLVVVVNSITEGLGITHNNFGKRV